MTTKVERLFKTTGFKIETDRIFVTIADLTTDASAYVDLEQFNAWLEANDCLSYDHTTPEGNKIVARMLLVDYWGHAKTNDKVVLQDLTEFMHRTEEEAYYFVCKLREEKVLDSLRDHGVVLNPQMRGAILVALRDYGMNRGTWARLQQCRLMSAI